MNTLKLLVVGGALAATASAAHAGGFILNDHGARATGRGDAVTASVTDGSAIFYNPGGVGAAEGTHIYIGGSYIIPDASFTEEGGGQTVDTTSPNAITPNAYFHASTSDMVRVGVGFNTPFGSTVEWPADSPGREQSRASTLRTFFITPVVGLKLDRWVPGLSVGGGIDFVPATVDLSRDILFGETVGEARLGGSGFGAGGRIGFQYRPKPVPGLAIGAAWRSPVAIDFDGTGDFDVSEEFRPALPPDGDIAARITLPQSVLAGVGYKAGDFEVEFNLQWVDWSEVETIEIELPDGSIAVDERFYKDAFTPRIGVEYALRQVGLDVRAGYAYDPTPIPDDRLTVSLPDIDRHVVSTGASYKLPTGYVDAGFLWVLPGENETAPDPNMPALKGTFEVQAMVFALSYGLTMK